MGVFHQYSMARLAQMPRLRELARNWLNFRLVFFGRLVDGVQPKRKRC